MMSPVIHSAPFQVHPCYKSYVWGGQEILKRFNRSIECDPCAESWEISGHRDGQSFVEIDNQRVPISQLVRQYPEMFGFKNAKLPLLIKLLDAQQNLSFQVHPCELTAPLVSGEPKNEMWYILDAKPDSYIYLGLKENLNPQQITDVLNQGRIKDYLNPIKVKAGDCYFVPAGIFHAIGSGCLIYEVQQSSNTTFRLYDWDREAHGKDKRELHLKESIAVMRDNQQLWKEYMHSAKEHLEHHEQSYQLQTPYFQFNKHVIESSVEFAPHPCARFYFVLEGQIERQSKEAPFKLASGQSFVIPVMSKPVEFSVKSDKAIILETIPSLA